MTFEDCVRATINHPDFLPEYDRLTGTSFSRGSGITRLIDQATGKLDQDARELVRFIHQHIWSTL